MLELGWFPHEAVPDGTVWVAHHYTYLALAAAFASFTVWDDYRTKEPVVVTGSLLAGVFAFLFMWPIRGYHELGAILALLMPVIGVAAIIRPRSPWWHSPSGGGYPPRTALAICALSVGALDDAVEHAFGVPTPLDTIFGIFGVWGSAAIGVCAAAAVVVAFHEWDRPRKPAE